MGRLPDNEIKDNRPIKHLHPTAIWNLHLILNLCLDCGRKPETKRSSLQAVGEHANFTQHMLLN